jgi:hypothetical protein
MCGASHLFNVIVITAAAAATTITITTTTTNTPTENKTYDTCSIFSHKKLSFEKEHRKAAQAPALRSCRARDLRGQQHCALRVLANNVPQTANAS